jgi:hypothetical protein
LEGEEGSGAAVKRNCLMFIYLNEMALFAVRGNELSEAFQLIRCIFSLSSSILPQELCWLG